MPGRPPGTARPLEDGDSWPRFDRWAAADSPPRPAPTTTTRISRSGSSWCGRSRTRRARRVRCLATAVMSAASSAATARVGECGDVRLEFVEARRCRRWPAGCARPRRRRGRERRRGRAPPAGRRRRGRPARASSGVGLPSLRSPPTGLPVTAASPNAPMTSSRIWKASPSGRPYALSCGSSSPARDGSASSGAEVERTFDRVLARLVAADPLGLRRSVARAAPSRGCRGTDRC